MRILTILAIALAAAAAAPAANAVICYTLLDRNDAVLYRGSAPPVDMSDQGAPQRQALRRQHEYLMIADVENCQAVAASGAAGYRPATVDEIVSEMRGYLSYGGISSAPGRVGGGAIGGGGGGEVAAPASGGAASAPRGRY